MAIREARWDCQYCGTKGVLGRHKSCSKCGRSRPEGTRFYLADDSAEVSDSGLVAEAGIGPDWICAFCSTSNTATAEACRSCGAGREESSSKQQVKEYALGEAPVTGDMADMPVERPVAAAVTETKSKRSPLAIVGVVGIGLLLCIGLFAALAIFGGQDVEATVSGFAWQRAVEVEAFRTVTEEDWSVPDGGRILDQREEIHHYEQVLLRYETRERQVSEQVQVGVNTYVCGQRDLGNGFFEDIECTEPIYETQYQTESYEEPIYRDEPVYQTKYRYEIERWVVERTDTLEGRDHSPQWPEPALRGEAREGARSAMYAVFFSASGGESYSLELPLQEWSALELGQQVTVKINAAGDVTGVEP